MRPTLTRTLHFGFTALSLSFLSHRANAQLAERLLLHDTPNANLTYVSTAVDGNGKIYSATSYTAAYTYEGQSIVLLNPGSNEEVLFCAHNAQGDLLYHKRIAVTSGSNPTVGRVEFMAVDSAGYAYLSTQGTTGSGFLRVENDSLAIPATGSMVVQLRPNGTLRSVRRFAGIRNVAARDTSFFMAFTDATDANKLKVQHFDSTFTTPTWSLEGNGNVQIGALAFERTQMAASSNGELLAVLAKEGGGPSVFNGQSVPFQTANGFDEFVVIVIDRDGSVVGMRTFFGSPSTGGQDEPPMAVAIANDGNVYAACFTGNTVSFAGNTYSPATGFSSVHALVLKWDDQGNEAWATQMLSQTTQPRVDGLVVNAAGDLVLGGSWGGNLSIGGNVLATASATRSVVAKLDATNGDLVWSRTTTAVSNNVRGYRIAEREPGHYVMAGRALQGYQFDCLDPVTAPNHSQFLLLFDESIPLTVTAGFNAFLVGNTVELTDLSTGATDHLWDFGDGSTSTVAEPQHTYTANGTYTITLIASNCLGSDTTTTQVTVVSTGIADHSDTSPWVRHDHVYDQLVLSLNHVGSWTIHDVHGRMITQGTFAAGSQTLTLTGCAPGLYVLRISDGARPKAFRFVRPAVR